jgi:hypothetical protein
VKLSGASRPRLAARARLKRDRRTGETVLLYPEHGMRLNESAAAIVRACDGRTAEEIATALAAPLDDVIDFLTVLAGRGLVQA